MSNIIGIAYVNKKMQLGTLVAIAVAFEALGMITISRYTLITTVTSTIKLEAVTNLRRSFIALGSTQMCSAFIMLNVLIFALPMSSTQIVISGLTGVSLIYFTKSETETSWFFDEIIMWVSMPILAMVLSFFVFQLIKKHIYGHRDACRIIVKLMPL